MDEKKIDYLPVDDLTPYERNTREHTDQDVTHIAQSIQAYGFNDPIGVWSKRNIIVEGHGRLLAAKRLGMTHVPVIHLDHMSDKQRRQYAIAHNWTAEQSTWNFENLKIESTEINIEQFGFDFPTFDLEAEPEEESENERHRTMDAYNLGQYDDSCVAGFYQMPKIMPCSIIPKDLIGFNYVLSSSDDIKRKAGVHFYIDDYQFQRIWNKPEEYLEKCEDFQLILTPDFSLYTEMPIAMQIWNVYRSRLIGQMAQRRGMNVIPTVSWCKRDSFQFCFDGLPTQSVVSVSTIGVKKADSVNYDLFFDGARQMLQRLHPKAVLLYGGDIDFNWGNTKTIPFTNHVTQNMKNHRGE